MKIGRRVLHTGIVAGGLLWLHAVATQDLHAQWLPIGSVTGGTTGSEIELCYTPWKITPFGSFRKLQNRGMPPPPAAGKL